LVTEIVVLLVVIAVVDGIVLGMYEGLFCCLWDLPIYSRIGWKMGKQIACLPGLTDE
jgi:hypothetical protein